MNKDLINRLFIIAWVLLAIAEIVFLCISFLGDDKTNTPLSLTLGCIALNPKWNRMDIKVKSSAMTENAACCINRNWMCYWGQMRPRLSWIEQRLLSDGECAKIIP